jgi:uncharacterized protein YjbI with pentapeptide repeats
MGVFCVRIIAYLGGIYMFVAIDNKDKNPVELEGLIQRTRNDGEITPEFAMEILSLTNFNSNIKKLVRAIKDKCKSKEEILPYKDFIVSCVYSREISEEALANLREMATLCGCDKEFEEANGKPKFYGKFDCNNTIIVKSREEFEALEGEDLKVYFDADKVVLSNSDDFSKVKGIKIKDGAEVELSCVKNLPECFDVSGCSKVNFSYCDLEGLSLKFREGAKVFLWWSKNLPKDLDISMCDKVDLKYCDLSGVKEIKFREGAEVILNDSKNLPEVLDISMCDKVDLRYCDLSGVKEIKFREGAEVNLWEAKNLPEVLDLSVCSKVNLSWCDLSGVKEIKFKEGAEIQLFDAKNLPEYLDFSQCSGVDLSECNMMGVKKVKFRDREQKNRFMFGAKYFFGNVIYGNSLFSRIRKRFGSGGMGE